MRHNGFGFGNYHWLGLNGHLGLSGSFFHGFLMNNFRLRLGTSLILPYFGKLAFVVVTAKFTIVFAG
jgi:hypothetical protein